MSLTCENLLPLSVYSSKSSVWQKVKPYNFLSFQDALHYLIKAHGWQGQTILLPAFYCDATLKDMEKHGLKIVLCQTDALTFDVDMADFKRKLRKHKPGIVLIYNFFGKSSELYKDLSWCQDLQSDAWLISDCAHSILTTQDIQFLTPRHCYIDSARKTTDRMLAHLVLPKSVSFNAELTTGFSIFKYFVRGLFFLRNSFFRLGHTLHINALTKVGMAFFSLHDHFIGSRMAAYSALRWDGFTYRHIDFKQIAKHREELYRTYAHTFSPLAQRGHIQLFDIAEKEAANLCFYFVRIADEKLANKIIAALHAQGYWADRLWEFDYSGFSADEVAWGRSILIFPYTMLTKPEDVVRMADVIAQVN